MFGDTLALCADCRARVPARHEVRDGKIFLVKDCPTCGPGERLVSTDAATWQRKRDLWHYDPEKVGHYLFEVSVHEIDFMRCVFGKPVAVSGWDVSLHGDQQLWARATTGAIEFEGGAMCLIIEGMFNPIGRTEVEISGSEAAMRFNWGGQFKFKTVSGEGDWEKPSSELAAGREDGRRRELREWIEAIANDTPATIPGEEGKANIELALAILQASAEKRRIELPL